MLETASYGSMGSLTIICSAQAANPDFLYAALDTTACAVFFKENRMKRAEAASLTGNRVWKPLDHRGNTLYDEDVAPALQLPTHPSG